jgi:hypothetical protein
MTARATASVVDLPSWCGRCIPRTRLLVHAHPNDPGMDPMPLRCPACHPFTAGRNGAAKRCGEHVCPPLESCGVCSAGIGPRRHLTVNLPPQRGFIVREPIDLGAATVQEMAIELRELKEGGAIQPRGYDDPDVQSAYQAVAARQAAQSRAARDAAGPRHGLAFEPEYLARHPDLSPDGNARLYDVGTLGISCPHDGPDCPGATDETRRLQ